MDLKQARTCIKHGPKYSGSLFAERAAVYEGVIRPHEIRDKVFEPFVTAGKENGLGLGLAFSRQAVLHHGGDMWIESAAGARFVIRFPLNGGEGF